HRSSARSLILGAALAVAVCCAAFAQQAPAGAAAPLAPAASPVEAPAAAPPAAPRSAEAAASPAATSVTIAALPRDLSPWGMFLNADIVVKIVMVGLVFASLVTWTVWLAKNWELWAAASKARTALAVLNEARTLAEERARLGNSDETVARLLR